MPSLSQTFDRKRNETAAMKLGTGDGNGKGGTHKGKLPNPSRAGLQGIPWLVCVCVCVLTVLSPRQRRRVLSIALSVSLSIFPRPGRVESSRVGTLHKGSRRHRRSCLAGCENIFVPACPPGLTALRRVQVFVVDYVDKWPPHIFQLHL